MRVLTLHPPWATLVALGVKSIETRGQRTDVRGRIAIHAAARSTHRLVDLDAVTVGPWKVFVDREYVWMEHYAVGLGGVPWGDDGYVPLPFGAIVATADLYDCLPIVAQGAAMYGWDHIARSLDGALTINRRHPSAFSYTSTPDDDELPFGDYRPGRWAWLLRDVQPVDPPVPFRGGQGWSRRWQP